MDELIVIGQSKINGEVEPTINARELHTFLGVGKDFSTWMQDRIRQYNFVENQDYICSPISGSKAQSLGRGGHNRLDYYLTIDMAKELSMVERTSKGKEARRYFIACEKELRSVQQKKVCREPKRTPANLKLPNGITLAMIRRDIKELMAFGRMAGLDRNQAFLSAVEHESILAGFDVRTFLPASVISLPSPVQDAVFLRPTDIAERLCLYNKAGSPDPRQANRLLEQKGLQIKIVHGDGNWQPTESGKPYAHWRDVPKAHVQAGRSTRQLFWREDILPLLLLDAPMREQPELFLQ